MFERFASWRVGILISGILLIVLWWATLGRNPCVIQIEFGIDPRGFEGLPVVIDGEVVGRLQRMGAATRTGFKVKDGDHTIRLQHPRLPSEPAHVTSGVGGRTVMLLADYQSRSLDGEEQTYIVLTR